MPKKRRKSRRTLYWAWPSHLENVSGGHLLVALYLEPVARTPTQRMVRVKLTRV